MKKVYLFLFLTIICLHCSGQNNKAIRITYKQNFKFQQIETVLMATLTAFNNKSLFQYSSKSNFKGTQNGQEVSKEVKSSQLYYNFIDHLNNEMESMDYIFEESYVVKEQIPKIEWKLINEKKTIGKFTCEKAEAAFRGRKYTAWYSAEIPINAGPWKLQGLPGLILEVSDSEGEVSYQATKIQLITGAGEIPIPKTTERMITWNEFKKKWKSKKKNIEQYAKTSVEPGFEVEMNIAVSLIEKSIFDK